MNVEETEINVEEEIKKVKIKPVFSRILIKEVEIDSIGGIYVPETSRQGGQLQTNEGYVLAVGEEVDRFKEGDRIYYGRYSGFWCEFGRDKYRIMNEEDVIGIIEK